MNPVELGKILVIGFLSMMVIFALLSEGVNSGILFAGAIYIDFNSIVKPMLDFFSKNGEIIMQNYLIKAQMTASELAKKIDETKTLLNDPNTPPSLKKVLEANLPILETEYKTLVTLEYVTTQTSATSTSTITATQKSDTKTTTTVSTVTTDPKGNSLSSSTTTITVDKSTMTGTVKTTSDYRGDIIQNVFDITTNRYLTSGMADKPSITGDAKITLRIIYEDGTTKDITRQITINIAVANLVEKTTGKKIRELQAIVSGTMKVNGMGDRCTVDIGVSLYLTAKTKVMLETFSSNTKYQLSPSTGWSVPLNLKVSIPVEKIGNADGEYTIGTSIEIMGTATEWDKTLEILEKKQIIRQVQFHGVAEGPSCSGIYTLWDSSGDGSTSFKIGGSYGGAEWIACLVSAPNLGLQDGVFKWESEKLKASIKAYVPGIYTFKLENIKGGKWSGTAFSIDVKNVGFYDYTVSYIDPPSPQPVQGKVNIKFSSLLVLSGGNDKLLQGDTIHYYLVKYKGGSCEVVSEDTLKSGETKTYSVMLYAPDESISVRAEKRLGSFEIEKTGYGGVITQTTYDCGDWYSFVNAPTKTVEIRARVTNLANVPQLEFETENNVKTVTLISQADTPIVIENLLPYEKIGQVSSDYVGLKFKLTVKGTPGLVKPEIGEYWFRENSKISINVYGGCDRVLLDGQIVQYGGHYVFDVIMNTNHVVEVVGGTETLFIIDGYVKNGLSDSPITNAVVKINRYGSSEESQTTTTDSKGYFKFTVKSRTNLYSLVISVSGMQSFSTSITAPNTVEVCLYPPSSSEKEQPPPSFTLSNNEGGTIVKASGVEKTTWAMGTTSIQVPSNSPVEVNGKTFSQGVERTTITVDKNNVATPTNMTADPILDTTTLLLPIISFLLGMLVVGLIWLVKRRNEV